MPRLFPHLGRSSKEHVAGYDAYDPYYGHPEHGYGYDGYEYVPEQRERSTWRKMLSRGSGSSSNTKSSGTRTGGRAYYGEGEVPVRLPTHRLADPPRTLSSTERMYPHPVQVPHYANSDETESYVNIPSRPHSPVPIVQRESSFTDMNGLGRLQEAFADHGTYSAAAPTVMMDPTTPVHGSPRMPPRPMHAAGPVRMGTMHEARHEPVIIDDSNGSVEGIRPDVDVMRPSSSKHRHQRSHREHERRLEREKVTGGPTYWEHHPGVHEYPPVVVVVQRGAYGEKDTYYIIPGGQPVIFEDDYGIESPVWEISVDFTDLSLSTPSLLRTNTDARFVGQAGYSDGRITPGPYFGRVNVQYLGNNTHGYQRSRTSRRERYDRMYDGEYDRGYNREYAPSYVSYPSPAFDEYADGRSPYK
ncbi:uncharacterized protein B0H18DRAFT_949919 [Fomitopsis serialis]|uniref:uncharacterized protein n=1 Tax=Fomitopsis serialis TaxID=139415 RepID=UPI0020077E9F|nr:uncharacterized protein B0H18DRAFT_949919 [Neoantrodia serialis]KAH9938651.1 hypothetical protein B0H18DRAFT_949919 [Neoantrodia serialis]